MAKDLEIKNTIWLDIFIVQQPKGQKVELKHVIFDKKNIYVNIKINLKVEIDLDELFHESAMFGFVNP